MSTASRSKAALKNYQCSFCTKPREAVRKLVAGPGVYICDECVRACGELLDDSSSVPKLAPWEMERSLEEVLRGLPQVASASAQLDEDLNSWVQTARSLGATWAQIGEALSVTRQWAWQRFAGEE